MAKKRKGPYAHQPVENTPKKKPAPAVEGTAVSDQFVKEVSQDPRIKLVQADFEKQAAENEAQQEEEVYGFWGKVYHFYNWYHNKSHGFRFKKKTYLWLLFLTGWLGGHRWYQGRRILGAIETAFFWTGIPFILCAIDFMEVVPLKPDENGYVVL